MTEYSRGPRYVIAGGTAPIIVYHTREITHLEAQIFHQTTKIFFIKEKLNNTHHQIKAKCLILENSTL